jgi:adenylyltransferase/sulfurtransferase
VYAGAVGTCGTTATIQPGLTPCLRCLQPLPPDPGTLPTCDTAGVLGSITALISSVEVAEALRMIVGGAGAKAGSLLSVDLWTGAFRTLDVSGAKNPECPCCADRRFVFLEGSHEPVDRILCGRNTVQITPASPRMVQLAELAERLSKIGVCRNSGQSVMVALAGEGAENGPTEVTIFKDGRVLVSGTTDVARARGIVGRILG